MILKIHYYINHQTSDSISHNMSGFAYCKSNMAQNYICLVMLLYLIILILSSYNFHKVIVDAGNGNVLSSQPVSKGESMMMHGMRMMAGGMIQHGPGGMMRGNGPHNMMKGGPGMSAPWHQW